MITNDPQAPHNTLGYDAADMLERLRWRLRDELRYCTADGVLIKNAIVEDALAMRPQLLQLLLGNDSDDPLRRNFFAEVAGVQVFDKVRFQRFVMNKRFLADSYTAFKNKIGLTTDDEHFLADSHEVVLTWPYKDCILEGGQTKDDARRRETFWSEILAPDQITQLTAPKALTNFKRYSSDGVQTEGIQLRDDDNLIIKGNNLLALYSLRERYRGRIKLIYIDPPYNTGNDSFGYNDSFNHSTWLTFMKNRLTVARDLLAPDGVIFVSLDDNEAHYCKVLMDEIFREENFLNDVIWNSTKSVTNTALISVSHTQNLVYFKNKEYFIKNRTEFRLAENGEGFSNPDNDPRGVWKADPFQVGGWRPNQQYEIVNPKTGKSYFPNEGCSWKNDYKKFQELLADNRIVFGTTGDAGPQRKRFKFEAEERGRVAKTIWKDVGTTTNGTQHLKKMFGSMVFSNPKPESLIQRVIELSTEEGDIVLDYHLGSGTTAAVAHKMGRQYIGVEQMDYIEDIAVERLRKVIAGEQGGISKSVDWQGGGDFVYCELASANQAYIDKIQRAETEELTDLSLEGLRHFLIDVLDKNLLYVPLSELESSEYSNLCAEDRRLTHTFYHEP